MTYNRSFDADTQRHCAAKRVDEPTLRGAMPLRAGQLRRQTAVRVIATHLATSSSGSEKREEGWTARLLRKVVPAANPDFESLYGGVRLWWVEVDDGGVPQREIGFGSGSKVLVVGPLEENMGFWTDSSMVFSDPDMEQIGAEAFEAHWSRFVATWYASRLSPRGAQFGDRAPAA